ncbi:MAG: integrase [Flavobacterium sp.]|nr:MAG: integrase [Flavobacterium sp.]
MATVNFKLAKGKADLTKVYIRLRDSGIDLEVPTHILVQRSHWNQNKQQVRNVAASDSYREKVNKKLSDIAKKAIDELPNIGNKFPDKDWLKDILLECEGKPKRSALKEHVYLGDYGRIYAEESVHRFNKQGEPISERTTLDYHNTVNKLEAFEKLYKTKIALLEADFSFHRQFVQYLRKVEKLGANTIGGQIANIKAFLRHAFVNKVPVHPAFLSQEFNAPSAKTNDPYFNVNDLKTIFNHKLPKDGYLDNARDWLVISCWTGLRVSDLLHLTPKDINKFGFIDICAVKTGIDVAIPLHPMVKDILAKRDGQFPRSLSDQKYNDYIKELCQEIGFDEPCKGGKMVDVNKDQKGKAIWRKISGIYPKYELITSHIGRRSFATNHYGLLDNLTIMKITGHKSEAQFLKYIKLTPKEHADRLAAKWKELYEKETFERAA